MKIIRPMAMTDTSFTRASTGTYYDAAGVLQTAAVDVFRVTYDPADLTASPNVLIEEQRTNLLTYSENFDNAAWLSTGTISVSADAAISPEGSATADVITDSDAAVNSNKYQGASVANDTAVRTGSVFVKKTSGASTFPGVQVQYNTGGTITTGAVTVNTNSGTLADRSGFSPSSGSSISDAGEYWRVSVRHANNSTGNTAMLLYVFPAVNSDASGTWVASTTGAATVWGAQLEVGSFATSYIATTTAAATRAADVIGSGTVLASNVAETDYTAFSAATVYSTGTRVRVVGSDIHKVYESLTGSTSVVTMTIASPCVVTWTAHGRADGDPISFTTTGTLPTGLVVGTVYYVKTPTANTFNVSVTSGGAVIDTSGTQSGVHTAVSSLNYNHTPPNTTYWLDVGSTNRWKCFDQSVQSQTSNANSITNIFRTIGRVDSVALLNIDAASATVTQTDTLEGVVYNTTVNLVSDSGITDLYAYFFEDIVRKSDLVLTDLLPYGNSTVSVTLTDTGGTALCGGMILGLSKDISYLNNGQRVGVEHGIKLGVQDYSIKQRDTFGNYTILERAFNKRADFTVYVDNTYVDSLMKLLSDYRATPVVYLGTPSYSSTAIYGFYKDFSVDIAHPTKSICTISIEGLT